MPEKVAKFSENVVNIVYVVGGIWTFIGIISGILLKYGHSLLGGVKKEVDHAKEINAKEIKTVNDKIKEVKKDQDHLREMHDDHYEFQKKIEPKFSELKNEVKNVVKDFDRFQDSHDNNHRNVK